MACVMSAMRMHADKIILLFWSPTRFVMPLLPPLLFGLLLTLVPEQRQLGFLTATADAGQGLVVAIVDIFAGDFPGRVEVRTVGVAMLRAICGRALAASSGALSRVGPNWFYFPCISTVRSVLYSR